MKSEGLTTTRLAEILGTQPSRISHIVSGRNNPSYDLLQTILRRFPRINPDWLLLDSENIYRDNDPTPLPFDVESGDSSTINLFGNSASDSPLFSSRSKDGVDSSAASQNRGAESRNFSSSDARNSEAKSQNLNSQNRGDFPADIFDSSARVERIIVLYSDNTFRTYNLR